MTSAYFNYPTRLLLRPLSCLSFALLGVLVLPLITVVEVHAQQTTADLNVTKSADEAVRVGGTIAYSINVFNGGPDTATNVQLVDAIPANTTFVSASVDSGNGTVSFDGTILSFTFASIPVFETGSATLVVQVKGDTPRGTTITNTVSGRSSALDPNPEDNAATVQTVVTGPFPGDLLISEFRLRGPAGATDEFIEIYNNTGSPHVVQSIDESAGYAIAASDGIIRCTIPNGTLLPARGHYLCVNEVGYSLSLYPAGESSTATGDATYTTDIPDNAGLALFRTANSESFDLANRFDAVGSTLVTDPLYKEGTGYPALSPLGLDYSFYRDNCGKSGSATVFGNCPTGGFPKDTDNNSVDFIFVSPDGNSSGAGARLGAPGPETLLSPVQLNDLFSVTLLDPCIGAASPPNRVRDFTSDPANNSTHGTLDIRRTVTNLTGLNVTRLRWRIVDITTHPTPVGIADLRARTSVAVVVTVDRAPCGSETSNVVVQGTTLEQPPLQLIGGGFNSSLSSGTVNLDTPLAPGQSLDVRFLLGIQKPGSFRFFVNVEALTREADPIPEDLVRTKSQSLRKRKGITTTSAPTSTTTRHVSGTIDAPAPVRTNTTVNIPSAKVGRFLMIPVEKRKVSKKTRRAKKRVIVPRHREG